MPSLEVYREAMGFPAAGDVVNGFRIEEVQVGHTGAGPGRYDYPTELVVSGKGGKEGARRALKELFARRRTIFSEYGNHYQCVGGNMEIESQGEGRYRVSARGVGIRVHLAEELARFLEYLAASGRLDQTAQTAGLESIMSDYMRRYQEQSHRQASPPYPRPPRSGAWHLGRALIYSLGIRIRSNISSSRERFFRGRSSFRRSPSGCL